MQGLRRHPSLVQQLDETRGNQRRGFRRLRHDGIAGRQRGRDLAGENRQGKIPRTDAGEHAAAVQRQLVQFAGGTRQTLGRRELGARSNRVIAAEVHGLANLRDGVRYALARLTHQEFMKIRAARFEQVGRLVEQARARLAPHCRFHAGCAAAPASKAFTISSGTASRVLPTTSRRSAGLVTGCVAPGSNTPLTMGPAVGLAGRRADISLRSVSICGGLPKSTPRELRRSAYRASGYGQPRMRIGLQAFDLRYGIADDLGDGHLLIHEAIHEGSIGAVFEQSPHQVGQQILVLAHGRVNAHPREFRDLPRRLGIQKPPHAVQPLKFIVGAGRRQLEHRCDAVCVVRRELRIYHIGVAEQLPHARQIGHIRGDLARVHRIAVETALLRALDFRVPISAFHQAHGHAPAIVAGGRRHPVDDVQGTLAVGLHRQPQARPMACRGILGQRLDHVQGQIQPVRFLGIDGQLNPETGGPAHQRPHQGHQTLHHPVMLQQGVA